MNGVVLCDFLALLLIKLRNKQFFRLVFETNVC